MSKIKDFFIKCGQWIKLHKWPSVGIGVGLAAVIAVSIAVPIALNSNTGGGGGGGGGGGHKHDFGAYVPEVSATFLHEGTKGHYHCNSCNKDYELVGNDYVELESLVIPLPHVNQTYYRSDVIVDISDASEEDLNWLKEDVHLPITAPIELAIEREKLRYSMFNLTTCFNETNAQFTIESGLTKSKEESTFKYTVESDKLITLDGNDDQYIKYVDYNTIHYKFMKIGLDKHNYPIQIFIVQTKNSLHEHVASDWKVSQDKGCDSNGYYVKVCTICGFMLDYKEEPKLGHDYDPITGICSHQCGKSISTELTVENDSKSTNINVHDSKIMFNFKMYKPGQFYFDLSSGPIAVSKIKSVNMYKEGEYQTPVELLTNLEGSPDDYLICQSTNSLEADTRYYVVIELQDYTNPTAAVYISGLEKHEPTITWTGNDKGSSKEDITLVADNGHGGVPKYEYSSGNGVFSDTMPDGKGAFTIRATFKETESCKACVDSHVYFIYEGSETYIAFKNESFTFNFGEKINIEAVSNHGEISYLYGKPNDDISAYTSTVPTIPGNYMVRAYVNASEGIDAAYKDHSFTIVCTDHVVNEKGFCKNGEYVGEDLNNIGTEIEIQIKVGEKAYRSINVSDGASYVGLITNKSGAIQTAGKYRIKVFVEGYESAEINTTDPSFFIFPDYTGKAYITIENISDTNETCYFRVCSSNSGTEITVGGTNSFSGMARSLCCLSVSLEESTTYSFATSTFSNSDVIAVTNTCGDYITPVSSQFTTLDEDTYYIFVYVKYGGTKTFPLLKATA